MFNHRRPCFLIAWRSFSHTLRPGKETKSEQSHGTVPAWEAQHTPFPSNTHCPGWKYQLIKSCSTENPQRAGHCSWNNTEGNTTRFGPSLPHEESNRTVGQPTPTHALPTHPLPVFAFFSFCASKQSPRWLLKHAFPKRKGWGGAWRDTLLCRHSPSCQPRCCAGSSWCGRSRRSLAGTLARAPARPRTPWRSDIRTRCCPRSRPTASPGAGPWGVRRGCSHTRTARPRGTRDSWHWPRRPRSPRR